MFQTALKGALQTVCQLLSRWSVLMFKFMKLKDLNLKAGRTTYRFRLNSDAVSRSGWRAAPCFGERGAALVRKHISPNPCLTG